VCSAGFENISYVGGRIKQRVVNGKSANLNHAIMTKLYPGLVSVEDIPKQDIIMVMDCDHMAKPDIFVKMGACMQSPSIAAALVPQVRAALPVVKIRHCCRACA
jgi:cellulose synthase/poly-beta-1,6-N-acetylglucosamine synthase-like glycosyltransferase